MQRIATATRAENLFGAGKHGFKDRNLGAGIVPTDFNAEFFNGLQEELLSIIEAAGIVPDAGTRNQVLSAIRRLSGDNITTINFAASPYTITAANAGLVLLDATAGNLVINLPAAATLAGLRLEFLRVDSTVNTVTINRAGANTIDGQTAFSLTEMNSGRTIRSDGVSQWRTPLNHAASLSSSGWQRLPSGLIVQWLVGVTNVTNGADSVFSWPIAFPSACLFASSAYTEWSSPWNDITTPLFVTAKSTTTVTLRSYTGNDNGVSIFGLGR